MTRVQVVPQGFHTPQLVAAPDWRRRNQMTVGHIGILWDIPDDIEVANRDIAEPGYPGFQTFRCTILEWNQKPREHWRSSTAI